MEKKIVGYADQFSVAPGERIRFMVHCEAGVERYRADIVRLLSGDTQPGGPGYRHESLATTVSGDYPGRTQRTHPGSYGFVEHHAAFAGLNSLFVQVAAFPTLPAVRRACLLSKVDTGTGHGFALWTDPRVGIVLTLGDGTGGFHEFSVGQPLIAKEWYRVTASVDARTGIVCLSQLLLGSLALDDSSTSVEHLCSAAIAIESQAPLLIAAYPAGMDRGAIVPGDIFNGRLERPVIARRVLDASEAGELRHGALPQRLLADVCAAWDFSKAVHSDAIVDLSANRVDGVLVNLPIRAVRGSNWTGEEMNYAHAPEHYGAVHFLEDSIYDCGWEVDFELEIPVSTKSGCYAAHLVADGQEDHIPFFVRPPRDRATAKLALLIPTASYLAYANSRGLMEQPLSELEVNHLGVIGPEERFLNLHPELGHSMYDHHADGTGVCYSSRLRPILNLRPKHGSLWQFSADLHLVNWLEGQELTYDVITDEDLHAEGSSLLKRYACVMTCTHPEYYSTPMWDGVYDYTQRGGRLMYMGGNGFYWRVAFHDDKPGVMEMRRAEDGSRSWIAEPGEYYMSFNGEYGGLWWRCGRPPQFLVGNGFSAQGFDHSSYFRRQPDSFDPRAAFIFSGVGDEEVIGDFGLIGNGAAGLELDRYDRDYGTPPHALKLASSENHTDSYLHVNEDIGHMYFSIGGRDDPAVRADMVFFETPGGGAVFSTGSISWCGSLFHNGYLNNVSTITRNVLDRFLDATPFG